MLISNLCGILDFMSKSYCLAPLPVGRPCNRPTNPKYQGGKVCGYHRNWNFNQKPPVKLVPASEGAELRDRIKENPTPELVDEMLRHVDMGVRSAAAREAFTPEQIDLALEDGDFNVRRNAVANPVATREQRDMGYEDFHKDVQAGSIMNPNITDEELERALTNPHYEVRAQVAKHSSSGIGVLKACLQDTDHYVKLCAAGNENCSPELLDMALEDPEADVQRAAARNPSLTASQLDEVMEVDELKSDVAKNTSLNPSQMAYLIQDKSEDNWTIRRLVMENPSVEDDILDEGLRDNNKNVQEAALKAWEERVG